MLHSPFQFYLIKVYSFNQLSELIKPSISFHTSNLKLSSIIMQNVIGSDQPSGVSINNSNPNQGREQSFMQRHQINAFTLVKIGVACILFAIMMWIIFTNLQKALVKARRQSKYSAEMQVKQISGLDQLSFRTYSYYKQVVQLAKNNTANGKKFDATLSHQFDGITFNELFGVFKVVKAIQYAKKYSAFSQTKQQEVMPYGSNVDPQILQKPYNYTQYFQAAANQYQCSSCYSFPITATIEYLYKRFMNITVKLSEQQLIDCSAEDQTVDGCNQGNITKGYQYAMKIGLVEQSQYPYRSKNGKSFPCRKEIISNPNIKKYKIDGYRMLPKENCQAIKYELSKGNVVAAMIAAGQLNDYTQIEKAPFRNCPKQPFNHAITVVGQTEQDQWIIRNSWGSSWGKNGYLIMRGNNTCGVCTHSIVPYLNNTNSSIV